MTQATPPHQPDEFDTLLQPLKIMLGVLVLMVVGGLVAGWFFIASLRANDRELQRQNDKLEQAIAELKRQNAAIIAARTEARHTTCARANLIREEAGNAAANKARDYIKSQKDYTGAGPSTGRLLEAENKYIESQRQETLKAYPIQDCSKAGVDAFYENPPVDPYAESCVPDGKGLCAK